MDRTSEVVLIHYHTKEIDSYGSLSCENHISYAIRHGLNWIQYDKKLDDRHPSWSRIKMILECFDAGFKWVFWIDPDAWIMNKDIDVRNYCDENFNIILSKESGSYNLGVGLWKNCKQNIDLLLQMDLMSEFYEDSWFEQRAFIYLVSRDSALKQSIKIEPQRIFQGSINDDNKQIFVLHLPGTSTEDRVRIFKEFYETEKNR